MEWVVPVVLVCVLVVLVLSWSAGRLDHLHGRVDRTGAVLDAELLRRSAAAQEAATSGLLDPASSLVLAEAAHEARHAPPEQREEAESGLTQALLVALEAPEGGELPAGTRPLTDADRQALLSELAEACRRVQVARRLHNDAVRLTVGRRRSVPVRVFRLAGHAPLPTTMEFDDTVPPALAGVRRPLAA
jgi:hypothetical protein